MNDEKDKQRRISVAAREQRERYKMYKLVDDMTERGVLSAISEHPLARLEKEEQLLKAWQPGLFADQMSMGFFRTIRAINESDIEKWSKAFLDYHPVPEQRSTQAIKAWSDDVPWPSDECGKEYAALAVRLKITLQIEEEITSVRRRSDLIQTSHDRMKAARRRAAVYDGDLDRARPAYCVGSGWHAILDDLVQEFSKIDGLGFLSAHEKWGELRVAYLYDGDRQADINVIIKRAADRCRESCWYCGQPGRMRQERWWRVRCEEHWSTTNE